ncbi:MAG: trypsin-like peptidase domain-containing protein [Myxococcota bacterium]
MSAYSGLFEELIESMRVYGPPALDCGIADISSQARAGKKVDPAELARFLKCLRNERAFSAMLQTIAVFPDVELPAVRTLEAQALIDTSQLHTALQKLNDLKASLPAAGPNTDRSETLGLIGRTHKQYFVSALALGDEGRAKDHLARAISSYHEAYPLDPAWNGANVAALTWRAEYEGIAIGENAADVGSRLIRDLPDVDEAGVWELTALAQGFMAKGDWDAGRRIYERFVDRLEREAMRSSTFMAFGDYRQLREIWLADAQDAGERVKPFEALERAIARGVFGKRHIEPAETASLRAALREAGDDAGRQLQALVAEGRFIYARDLEMLMRFHPCIGRVERRNNEKFVGTGFLMDGHALDIGFPGPVLVTNEHVLSDHPRESRQLRPAEARVRFERWTTDVMPMGYSFPVRRILRASNQNRHDVVVAQLEGLGSDATTVKLSDRDNPFPEPTSNTEQDLGWVHPIGYPGGSVLSYSFGGNDVIDHDLHLGGAAIRVVHYKANTEPGSSGSPVFDRNGRVVAIHRASVSKTIEGTPKAHPGNYKVNEGVGLLAVLRALRTAS